MLWNVHHRHYYHHHPAQSQVSGEYRNWRCHKAGSETCKFKQQYLKLTSLSLSSSSSSYKTIPVLSAKASQPHKQAYRTGSIKKTYTSCLDLIFLVRIIIVIIGIPSSGTRIFSIRVTSSRSRVVIIIVLKIGRQKSLVQAVAIFPKTKRMQRLCKTYARGINFIVISSGSRVFIIVILLFVSISFWIFILIFIIFICILTT